MTNNKQLTAVEWYISKIKEARNFCDDPSMEMDIRHTLEVLIKKGEQTKEMEIAGKEMSYAEGYKEGYHRAIENAKYQINKWIDKELKITQ
jgi:flagellar biosynthesis/type III secretory pathway protein FliH